MKSRHTQTGSAHVVIIIVLVIAVLGALGFIFWQNFLNKPAASTTTTTTTKTTASDTTTYKNTDLGFSVDYPSTWKFATSTAAPVIATLASPDITTEQKAGGVDSLGYDVGIQTQPKSGPTSGSQSAAILALNGNAAQYASMKYTETINSISATEYDMNGQSPYFAAIFPIGANYIELDFNYAATKADMTTTLTAVLQSVKAL